MKNLKKRIIKFFNDRQRTTILKNLEIAEILQNENKNLSLLQVREARDYFSKELEDHINVGQCESHPWSNIQFWSSFHRKRCITSRLTSEKWDKFAKNAENQTLKRASSTTGILKADCIGELTGQSISYSILGRFRLKFCPESITLRRFWQYCSSRQYFKWNPWLLMRLHMILDLSPTRLTVG